VCQFASNQHPLQLGAIMLFLLSPQAWKTQKIEINAFPHRIPLFANCLPTAMPSRSHSRSNIVRHSGLQAGQYKQRMDFQGSLAFAQLSIFTHIHKSWCF
jgi:hypothetical protein